MFLNPTRQKPLGTMFKSSILKCCRQIAPPVNTLYTILNNKLPTRRSCYWLVVETRHWGGVDEKSKGGIICISVVFSPPVWIPQSFAPDPCWDGLQDSRGFKAHFTSGSETGETRSAGVPPGQGGRMISPDPCAVSAPGYTGYSRAGWEGVLPFRSLKGLLTLRVNFN